jgi:hypothetical protein
MGKSIYQQKYDDTRLVLFRDEYREQAKPKCEHCDSVAIGTFYDAEWEGHNLCDSHAEKRDEIYRK